MGPAGRSAAGVGESVSLVGAAAVVDDDAVHEFANVVLVKQSLAKTVEKILKESSTLKKAAGEVQESGLPSENAAMQNDRGNHFGIPREDLKLQAMTV
jgi:hypothetical protein